MKTFILILSFYLGIFCLCLGYPVQSYNELTGYSEAGNFNSANAENTTIDPPIITFSPDTVDGGGIVKIKIKIDDPDGNFSGAHISINGPDGNTWVYDYLSYYDLKNGVYTYSYDIKEYYPSGYWYINEIELYYVAISFTYNSAALHSGFYVINTQNDIMAPVIKHFEVSKDTAFPGDTVCIKVVLEDTGSGLSSWNFEIRDISDYFAFIYNSHYYYYEDKKIDTLLFFYIIGKYEIAGCRNIYISTDDKAGNYITYNKNDLDFNLVITGTTEDKQLPVVKSVTITNNSQNGEIILEVTAKDDISGLHYFSAHLSKLDSYNTCSFSYQDDFVLFNDFTKINDSVYRCNILTKDPYLPTGTYFLSLSLHDYAQNSDYLDNFKLLEIYNVNSDEQPPEVVSVEFSKDTVIAGEPVTVIVKLRDDKSGFKKISGDLGNGYFRQEFDEPGTINYNINKTIYLPEFGQPGLRSISYISVSDYSDKSDYYFSSDSDWPSFMYYPKYVDTIPPVFENITFEPEVVIAGDTITATIVASDNLSGIKNIDYWDDYLDSYFYRLGKWFMTAHDTFKLIIPINEYAKDDTIMYELSDISDAAENMIFLRKHGTAYRIISSGEVDTLPPVFDSLFILDTIANPEDTLTLIFYLHDDKSGIDPWLLCAYFEHYTEDNYANNNLLVFPVYNDENQYIVKLSANALDSGEYRLSTIGMSDKAGNYFYPIFNDYYYVSEIYTFQVIGENISDTDDPVLAGIRISPKIAQPGDTVNIEITAVEKTSGIASLYGTIKNNNGVDIDVLGFNSWEITGLNDTFKCITNYIIPDDATNGKWIISSLGIGDYYDNGDNLEYGNDYYDADFQVTGGHSYPNRPPTWVIPEINLTIEADNQLNYKIPGYIINDIDGDELNYSAVMENGIPLIPWINFSSEQLRLSFNPVKEDKGIYKIYIIASDPGGLSDSIPVNLTVNYFEPTGMSLHQVDKIKIYPNPAIDFINIECPYTIESVTFYELTGKTVYKIQIINDRLNVSELKRGVYILTVETERMTIIEKVLIQ